MSTDYERAYFERGFIAAAAWEMTKKRGVKLSDAVIDHAWDHRDEGMGPTECLPKSPTAAAAEREEVARLREALKPFAFEEVTIPRDLPLDSNWFTDAITGKSFTVGQVLAARAILAKLQPSDRADEWEGKRLVLVAQALARHPDSSWDDYEWADMPSFVQERFLEQASLAIAAISAYPAELPAADRREAVSEGDIPTGMVRWHGGDSAPDDWDGGPVLFRNRMLSVQSPGWRWKWKDPIYHHDIIAYTPLATAASTKDKS